MLSRSAESVYWASRYLERAEDITRLLGVNFNAMLEARVEEHQLGWLPLVKAFGNPDVYRSAYGEEVNAHNVTEYLLWHPANPNAVLTCIQRTRENLRSVREQISTEMWEHINRIYHHTREIDQQAVLQSPYDFFHFVRDASQAFQGITGATMTHGEPYEFIQLGKYIERGSFTVEILSLKYANVRRLQDGSPEAVVQLIVTLKSCSAFEPYRRTYAAELQAWRVMEYLLLNPDFPRSANFCMKRCADTINAVAGQAFDEPLQGGAKLPARRPANNPFAIPLRHFGRICADLEYLDIREVLGDPFQNYLNDLLKRVNLAGDEVMRTFFNTQIILPDAYPQTQQQQQ
jgi:uncharacterized alpha-E superfamily protein